MTNNASAIRDRAEAVHAAGVALRAYSLSERAAWLEESAHELERRAREASSRLSEATGLSVPMVEWAAHTSLRTIRKLDLLSLAAEALGGSGSERAPIALLSVIVSGNVFTASVRAIFVPLLLGVPVLVKASSRETSFLAMLRAALRQADGGMGSAIDVVSFPGGDVEREAALCEQAEAVAAYGSDETIAAIAARLGDTPLLAHGHGVSAAYCGRNAFCDASIEHTIASLSLDICAYDQRGCLSPQIVFLQKTHGLSLTAFAERLSTEGLGPMSETLPRGPMPMSVGAAQAQWRGLAEVEGELIRGPDHAIALRSVPPVRWSPAYRNVTLAPTSGLDEALDSMKGFAQHLKCVGADRESCGELSSRLSRSPTFSAYACPLGQMQTPALDAPADGRPVWLGLLRP